MKAWDGEQVNQAGLGEVLLQVAIDPVARKSSRERLAVTMTTLVRVRDSCGSTAISRLRQISGQVGMTSCGMLGVKPI